MRRKDREVTDPKEIKAIINKADACRIALAVENTPYIVALNFGYEWNDELPVFYFHCAHEGKKLDMMKQNSLVCLQLDVEHEFEYIEETVYCTMNYGSIIAMGKLEIITDEAERIKGLDLLMEHSVRPLPEKYPESSLKRTTVLRLTINELTAKQKAKKPSAHPM